MTTETAALEAAGHELERAEDAAAQAGHAVAELEERAEEEPGLADELAAALARLEAAEVRLGRARAKVRELGG